MGSWNINPWTHIWTSPKKTMRAILGRDPKRFIIWLAIIGGIISSLNWNAYLWTNYPDTHYFRHTLFIISMIVIGAIIGILSLYIGGWLFQLTGSWLGGKGTFIDVKSAVGWSNYPFILANIASFISIVMILPWFKATFGLINVVLAVWGFIIFLNLVGEAHRFSAWRALLASIIAWVLIFVVIMLISLLVPLLSPLFSAPVD